MDDERWSAFDLAEGFHLAHALVALHDTGVLAYLRKPATAAATASKLGLDRRMLEWVLEYVAARSAVVTARRGGRYATAPEDAAGTGFLVDQYLGAYGPNAGALPALLRNPARAGALVDRKKHARAFAGLGGPSLPALPGILRQLGLNRVLDLGCGPAELLVEMAARDPGFTGWGLDASAAMCRAARRRISTAGVAGRVRVFAGDCRNIARAIPERVRARVECLSAASLLNEFFAGGPGEAVAWLRDARRLFPGRLLVVADYYGRLGHRRPPWSRKTGLHDFVQAISGQGVPPPDVRAWKRLYARAGCQLGQVLEDRGSTAFIHFVRL
jgi:SAM-dependent methyltransferase